MKLKMSENSLFAVLLRAPWWISLVVMSVFALAAAALLPREYVPFGVMGAFPFLVIGCITAWRQWHAPSPAALEQLLAHIASLPWRDFAQTVEKAAKAQGYAVERLNAQAADFSLRKGGKTSLLCCKRWKAASQGVEAVRELVAAVQLSPDASAGLYFSLTPVSGAAQQLAKAEGISLLSDKALAQWLLA